MKIKYIIYALLVIGLSYLVVYRISANKKLAASGGPGGGRGGAGGPGGAPAMQVNGVVLQPEKFANVLAVNGSIIPNEQVQIRSEVSGLVRSITFQEGSQVKKGQVLVKIDDTELRAQLSQALTRQTLAAENAQRARQLLAKEAISREENDVAQADLKSAQAQTQLIRAQLAKTTIEAPFTGKIGLRAISQGAFISPDLVIANLVSTDPVKITFSVPEKYASEVKLNTTLTFTVTGSDKEHNAQVYAIEPGIDVTSRSLQLRAKAANPNGELLPGSFANVQLPLSVILDALLVPTEAVVPVQNGKKVFVSQNGKVKEALIETSTRTEKDVLVTAGLSAGDTVLTTGVMTLKEGAPVKVKVTNNQLVSKKI